MKSTEKTKSVLAPSRPKKRLLKLGGRETQLTEIEPASSSKKEINKTKIITKENNKLDIVFSWQAPERVWEPKTKTWYLSSTVVVMILILIMAKLGYIIIILGLIAVLMLWFVQGTLEPWTMIHKITTKGIYTNSRMLEWDQIRYFWFTKKGDQVLLHIDPNLDMRLPRLTILVNEGDDFLIFEQLHNKITYGDSEQLGHNMISNFLDGQFLPISIFLPDLDHPT